MKHIYRRPYQIHSWALQFITLLSVITLYIVEWRQPVSYDAEMKQSIELAKQGMALIKEEKLRLGIMAAQNVDPEQTGLIGSWETTPVTSVFGHLRAKQVSINPLFAALVYRWLKESGVNKGDYVAVSASGSFPALNLYTYAALQTLEAKPLIMLSLTASQWGANQPSLMWIDMSSLLKKSNLISFSPPAVSYGAKDDLASNLSQQGIRLLDEAINRNGNPPLIYKGSLSANIEEKWLRYQHAAQGKPIRAYINIGGGKASAGSIKDKKELFKPGFNSSLPKDKIPDIQSLMWEFINADIPVIHLSNIEKIVLQNNLNEKSKHTLYQNKIAQQLTAIAGVIIILLSIFTAAYIFRRKQEAFIL